MRWSQRDQFSLRALGRSGGGGNEAAGAVGAKELNVFTAIAALALASTSAQSPATLNSTAPWWERVTVIVTDDGKAQSCRYETSLQPADAQDCAVSSSEAAAAKSAGGAKDQYTRITFERRFIPGTKPVATAIKPGETLLGGQVMALAIDAKGAVKRCKIVAMSGAVTPDYGCDEAAAERFEASAGNPHAVIAPREGYMTILVYGHSEHVV
jgi:hypothetical protein